MRHIFALLRSGDTVSFEEMSQRTRTVGNTAPDLTGPRFEPHTSRSKDERVSARLNFLSGFFRPGFGFNRFPIPTGIGLMFLYFSVSLQLCITVPLCYFSKNTAVGTYCDETRLLTLRFNAFCCSNRYRIMPGLFWCLKILYQIQTHANWQS